MELHKPDACEVKDTEIISSSFGNVVFSKCERASEIGNLSYIVEYLLYLTLLLFFLLFLFVIRKLLVSC